MANSSSRRSLKSLFSRSEVSLDESVQTAKNEEEKTKFRFLKFKKKTKSDPVPAKAANEIQQQLSAAEPTDTAKDGEAWDDIIAADRKSSIYGTTSRSKGKEFSYSELDLRKPKRFTSFTFAFRKKKSDRVNISQSTIGLNHANIEEQAETPQNHRQMELDQANTKTVFSMPQPELDTIDTFDIPSPPPVATNQSESYFPLPNQSQSSDGVGAQPEAMERLANGSSLFYVPAEPQKAPIATIPELQLDNPDSLDEKRDGDDDSSPSTTHAETRTAVDNQTVPSLPASRPLPALDTSHRTTAFVDNIATSDGPCDDDILRQSRSNTEISHTRSTRVTLSSQHQPGDLDMADSTSQHGELSASADSQIDGAVAQSTAVPHADASALDSDSASVHQEVSISRTERSAAVTARSAAKASAVGGEKGASPVRQDVVYGALYDSLFPQSFGSGLMSSPSNPPPQIITEIRHLDSKSAPVVVKTLNEHHTETSVQFDSAARRVDDAVGDYTNVNATFSERKVIYSSESSRLSSYQTSGASERLRGPDIYTRYSPSSLKSATEPGDGDPILYSEPTPCLSEVKSDSFSLIQDNVRSVPTVQSPAPPVSDYVISQGGDTRVTHSKRRAILVKELVTDEASSNPICLSPVSENMSSATRLEVRIETIETFFAPSGQARDSDGLLSPSYLSVGSDDPAEIYYSAEEDNEEGSGNEEMYPVYERVESHVVDGGREAGLRQEFPQQAEDAERGIRKREEGEFRVVIIKTQNEGVILANEEEKEDVNSRFEVEEKARGQRSDTPVQEIETSDCLVGSDAQSREKEVATAVLPQVGDEGAEELPATPVQQVDKPTVCDFAPPSSEPHGQGEGSEGNLTDELETEDPPNGEAALPGQEAQYLAHKDLMSSEYMHTASSSMGEGDTLTPRPSEAEKQVSPAARTGEASQDATETTGTGTAGVTTTSAGGEAVTATTTHATEVEHNRAASSEWVDTITQSTERTATVQEQVAVSADTRLPNPEAAGTRSERRPSEAQPDPNQGSPTASRTLPTAASEGFASVDQPPKVETASVTEMNSSYSSISTKLYIKNSSPPKEDESKNRFRKVSLINEVSRDTVDFSQDSTAVESESNGTDNGSDCKWRNRFEGVSQYRPHNTGSSSFSDSLSYRMSDSYSGPSSFFSSSSALPDSTAYKDLSNSSSSYQEEHVTISNRLSDMTKVSLSYESEPVGAPKDEWRRSLLEREEPAAPAGEREGEAEAERLESRWDSQQLPVSGISSAHGYDAIDRFEDDDDSSCFTGVFKATLVELVSEPAAPPSIPPASPDEDSLDEDSPDEDSPIQFDMDILVDTLKSMGPSLRPRNTSLRGAPPCLVSSLPPIVEDASSPVTPDIPAYLISPAKKMEAIGNPAESLKGVYTLPSDVGLKRNISRDTRSPLELMKQNQQEQQQEPGTRSLNLSLRSSLTNSLVLRRSSDSSPEELKSPTLNGNGLLPPSITGSRLENSVIFGSHRSASTDQTFENGKAHRPLFRTGSLPEKGPSNDRMSSAKKELSEPGSGTEPAGSRFERFSFLLNSTSSPSGSLVGAESSTARMSLPPLRSIGSPPSSNSPTRLLSPTGSIDLQRPFTTTDSPFTMFGQTQGMGVGADTGAVGNPILQRSFSSEGTVGVQQTPLFNSRLGGSQFQSQELESEKNLTLKYRAFPDAYLTKEKEHGKLNPRPGKMYIFDRPGMCGQRIEVRSDVIDATPWELQETISIRVVRGGWVLYEKPNFKGEKIALDEGDIELTYPFDSEEQLQNGEQNGETSDVPTEPARRFIIGSLRRAVRDYSVPEICLFPEENAEGKKVTFRDTSEDARIFGFPIKANSIIINAGLWLVYAHPFFQGLPRVLEVGGFSNPAAWGVEQPYVGSLHPLKVGEPRVENTSEPKMVIFDKPYFTGKSRTISTNMRDFMTRADRKQTAFMYNVGSLKVQGGMWVGYEKEGFRGHQYLLEEGEYHDWRVWGGRDAELRSVRVIRADLTDPIMVMFEQPDEEQEGMEEENTFEVTEAIPDVELFEYRTSTRSIHVLSGAWIAYSHVDYSGDQYILEKGFYNNCADWGSQDSRICSVQPIRLAPGDSSSIRAEVILYSEPDFQGECHVFKHNQEELPEKLLTKSCRVSGASWVLYENTHHSGNLYVLSEGDFPNLTSMGCPPVCNIRSVKVVPMTLSVPSISLFGLECLEGREITMDTEIPNMVEEGFNNHILSVRVNSSCWVICEHSNYRGRQFLLEPIEITNWPKFSSIQTIGSMFPVRQKRRFLRIKNKERGHCLSVQGGVEEMKSGRVVVTPEVEPMSDIWFYQDGFIKSKLSPTMSLQVMGTIEPAAKVVLWAETRQPVQTWTAQMRGLITSLTFPGCVLDVKGGKTYDKDHVVIMPENEERPSQQWYIELL